MSNSLRSLVPRGAKAAQRRVAEARQSIAPGIVRRLACVDGETLQAVVETRTDDATVRLTVHHPAVGSVAPVHVHGRVHRFHIPLGLLLDDPDWDRVRMSVTVGRAEIPIPERVPSALLDGPAVARGDSWLSTVVKAGAASIVRHSTPARVRLIRGTSTASGIRLTLPLDVSEVRLTRSRDAETLTFETDGGVIDIPLEQLAARGWDGPDYWHASCVSGAQTLPLTAPDDNVKNVHLAYNFPMLIVRDADDGLLYFAKPYFANPDRALTIRTGIRPEPTMEGPR